MQHAALQAGGREGAIEVTAWRLASYERVSGATSSAAAPRPGGAPAAARTDPPGAGRPSMVHAVSSDLLCLPTFFF